MPADSIQVPIQGLAPLYARLAIALKGFVTDDARVPEILNKSLQARCAQCGTLLSGADLERLSVADAASPPTDVRLGRLTRGYCAGKDCSSSYYQVELLEYPDVDWAQVRAKADQAESTAPASEAKGLQADPLAQKKQWSRVGIGVGIILVLLLIRFIYYHGYVPVVQQPKTFAVDPASTNFPAAQ